MKVYGLCEDKIIAADVKWTELTLYAEERQAPASDALTHWKRRGGVEKVDEMLKEKRETELNICLQFLHLTCSQHKVFLPFAQNKEMLLIHK